MYLLRGILIGLLFGIPVGAVGALTIQRTLHYHVKAGLLTGLGSSVADCFYAAVGAFGLTMISDFLLNYQTIIHILGGTLILLMGLKLVLKENGTDYVESLPPIRRHQFRYSKCAQHTFIFDGVPTCGRMKVSMETPPVDGMKMFLASFAVGITNPAAILTFLFAFSYFEIPASMDVFQRIQLVAGVFIGTYIWWSVLSISVDLMKKKARAINRVKINRVFGMILMLFGIVMFVRTAV